MKHNLSMYLPRSNGTKQTFCENNARTRRPCSNYITFNEEGVLISGLVVYHDTNQPRHLCSWKCAESYAKKRTKMG